MVIGGDGTVHRALPSLLRSGCPVWHAPLGTENLLARTHGMSADPRVILRSLRAGRTTQQDLGAVNGRPFAIMVSLGPDASIVNAVNANRRGAITHLSYAAPVLRELLSPEVAKIHLSLGNAPPESVGGMLVLANLAAYGAGLNPAWDARHDDGALDAVLLPGARALGVGLRLMACWSREPVLLPGRRQWRSASMTVTADPNELPPAQVDGEPMPASVWNNGSLTFETLPGALRLVRPAT